MRGLFTLAFRVRRLALATLLCLTPGVALAGNAACYMHGIITPTYGSSEKYSLSDMIRMHFDVNRAEEKDKCEQMMESYCIHNVKEKDYNGEKLKGSFKPDVDKAEETTYHFTASCKIAAD